MIYLIVFYFICFFIVAGFQMEKSESPFIKRDAVFVVGAVAACLLGPVTLSLIIGYKLHGRGDA